MKKSGNSLKATLTGGIFFLVPVVLLVLVLGKAFKFIQDLIVPIIHKFPGTYFERAGVKEIIAIFFLLILCLLAGLFARTSLAKKIVNNIEDNVLSMLPGYSFMKRMGESVAGVDSNQDLPVVLARFDDSAQLGFQIEKVQNGLVTVYLPGAPSPWSGTIVYMEASRVVDLQITQKQALDIIKKLGGGSAELMKGV